MKHHFTLIIFLLTKLTFGQAISEVDTLPSGELMLKQSISINASIDKLWKAYTDSEEWKQWVTPIVEMDFRIK